MTHLAQWLEAQGWQRPRPPNSSSTRTQTRTESLICRTIVGVPNEDTECGGEIEVEWEAYYRPPQRSGRRTCMNCNAVEGETSEDECEDFEGGRATHRYEEEWEEVDEDFELISYKTYCWHPLTKDQAMEMLNDKAVEYYERRAEQGRI